MLAQRRLRPVATRSPVGTVSASWPLIAPLTCGEDFLYWDQAAIRLMDHVPGRCRDTCGSSMYVAVGCTVRGAETAI